MTDRTSDPAAPFDALAGDRELSAVPTPRGPWIMGQRWEDLLFISWPVPVEAVRPFVAPSVEVDTFDGSAWVSAVPFWMERAHFRGLPPIPFISSFPEVNVRTYVRQGDHAGVWFLSLDTESQVNVFLARHAFHLPYFFAHVEMERGGREIAFRSSRTGGEAAFDVTYRGLGDERVTAEGTLEHFLTERYSMVCERDGDVYRGDIQHAPWRVQQASWTSRSMDVVAAAGVAVPPTEPAVFYAQATDVALWAPIRV